MKTCDQYQREMETENLEEKCFRSRRLDVISCRGRFLLKWVNFHHSSNQNVRLNGNEAMMFCYVGRMRRRALAFFPSSNIGLIRFENGGFITEFNEKSRSLKTIKVSNMLRWTWKTRKICAYFGTLLNRKNQENTWAEHQVTMRSRMMTYSLIAAKRQGKTCCWIIKWHMRLSSFLLLVLLFAIKERKTDFSVNKSPLWQKEEF